MELATRRRTGLVFACGILVAAGFRHASAQNEAVEPAAAGVGAEIGVNGGINPLSPAVTSVNPDVRSRTLPAGIRVRDDVRRDVSAFREASPLRSASSRASRDAAPSPAARATPGASAESVRGMPRMENSIPSEGARGVAGVPNGRISDVWGVQELDLRVEEIREAKKSGAWSFIGGLLSRFYAHETPGRRPAGLSMDSLESGRGGSPVGAMNAEGGARTQTALADRRNILGAPALFADEMARVKESGPGASKRLSALRAAAVDRAVDQTPLLVSFALRSAASGGLLTETAKKAVRRWSESLAEDGKRFIINETDIIEAIDRLKRQASERPGSSPAVPEVLPLDIFGFGSHRRVRIPLGEARTIPRGVESLAADLASKMELSELRSATVPGVEAGLEPGSIPAAFLRDAVFEGLPNRYRSYRRADYSRARSAVFSGLEWLRHRTLVSKHWLAWAYHSVLRWVGLESISGRVVGLRVVDGPGNARTAEQAKELRRRLNLAEGAVLKSGEALRLAREYGSRKAGMTQAEARAVYAKSLAAAAAYEELSGDGSMILAVEDVWRRLTGTFRSRDPNGRLASEQAGLVGDLGQLSMYRADLIGRERALGAVADASGSLPSDASVEVRSGNSSLNIPALDLRTGKVLDPRVASLAARAMAASVDGPKADRRWSWILGDRYFMARFAADDRVVELYAHPGSSREGGMLKIRYSKPHDDRVASLALRDFLAEAFYGLNFSVFQDGDGALVAVLDPDGKNFTEDGLERLLERAVRVAALANRMGPAFDRMTGEAGTSKELAARIAVMAEAAARTGSPPNLAASTALPN